MRAFACLDNDVWLSEKSGNIQDSTLRIASALILFKSSESTG
jgi:hypothetical protein